MPHTSTKGRAPAAAASLIMLLAVLGLAACGSSGSSSSTSAQTAANAAATGTPTTGATSPGTTSSGTSSHGSSTTGTTTTGTTTTGTTTAAPAAAQPNATRYNEVRECLSKKGIVLPQRTQGAAGLVAGGSGITVPKGMSHAQLSEALRTCNVKYAGGHVPPPGGAAAPGRPLPERFHRVLARFAACLRQNGIPVGEPNTSGKGPLFNTKGINTGSPQFRAAAAKCRSALFGKRPPREAGSSSATATG